MNAIELVEVVLMTTVEVAAPVFAVTTEQVGVALHIPAAKFAVYCPWEFLAICVIQLPDWLSIVHGFEVQIADTRALSTLSIPELFDVTEPTRRGAPCVAVHPVIGICAVNSKIVEDANIAFPFCAANGSKAVL